MRYDELQDEIKNAMRAKDKPKLSILRQVHGEIKNIEVNERRDITDADVDAMLKRLIKQTKETLDGSIKAGNDQERTDTLTAQVAILESYLPKQVSGDELAALIDEVLAEPELSQPEHPVEPTAFDLAFEHVTFSYDGKKNAVEDVTFRVPAGSVVGLVGPSGGGKSTLLRIVGGLIAPTGGTVEVDGERVDYDERVLPSYRSQLGFVFQASGLFHHLSALENVALPLSVVHGVPEDQARERAANLLARFGLAAEEAKRPAQLSGGQQQRVAIARAVAASPKMLLLDEPTSALDPEYTNDVLDLIRDLKETGTRFIVVTHEMGFARRACDKVAFLHGGRLLEYGESARLFDHPATPELQRFLGKLLEWSIR